MIQERELRYSLALLEGLFSAFLNGPYNTWGEALIYCFSQLFQKIVALNPTIMRKEIKRIAHAALTSSTACTPP